MMYHHLEAVFHRQLWGDVYDHLGGSLPLVIVGMMSDQWQFWDDMSDHLGGSLLQVDAVLTNLYG